MSKMKLVAICKMEDENGLQWEEDIELACGRDTAKEEVEVVVEDFNTSRRRGEAKRFLKSIERVEEQPIVEPLYNYDHENPDFDDDDDI